MPFKYIREGRFGPPKTWKTGSVLDTYPTPIGYIGWDQGGHEIARKRKYAKVTKAEWKEIRHGRMKPPADITVIDCSFTPEVLLVDDTVPIPEETTFKLTVEIVNTLLEGAGVFKGPKNPNFPFKTIVGDPVTELSKSVLRWISKNRAARLADARKWAGDVGAKVEQVLNYINMLATKEVCHAVTIFHSEIKENEDTKEVRNLPMVFSNLKSSVGGMYTQFFYQDIIAGKPQIKHMSYELVKGIGARWPEFDAKTTMVGPTFEEIYAKEKDVLR